MPVGHGGLAAIGAARYQWMENAMRMGSTVVLTIVCCAVVPAADQTVETDLMKMLASSDGRERVAGYEDIRAGDDAGRTALKEVLGRVGREPPIRRLSPSVGAAVAGRAIRIGWRYEIPDDGMWGSSTLHPPRWEVDPVTAPVQVRLANAGAFGSRSGGGRRRAARHPLEWMKLWLPGEERARGGLEIRPQVHGMLRVFWPRIESQAVSLPALREQEEPPSVLIPGALAQDGIEIPVLPDPMKIGVAHDGLALNAEIGEEHSSVRVWIEHQGPAQQCVVPWSLAQPPVWLMLVDEDGLPVAMVPRAQQVVDASESPEALVKLGPESRTSTVVSVAMPPLPEGREIRIFVGYGPVSIASSDGMPLAINASERLRHWTGALVAPVLTVDVAKISRDDE